ncbi:MAG TPA: gamma-glutamyltransferase [Stellaceae bacterium]|jgi:gamma-glutamyltranspeptidase/glutathione hydrolase
MTRLFAALLVAGLLATSAANAQQPAQQPATSPTHDKRNMVAAANPIAAAAGRDILRKGGNAIDAAIATQLVLNLVEPESSGIGGGAFLVYYAAKDRHVTTFDGRETAPAAAKGDRFIGPDGKPMNYFQALVGGRSVGVPGVLRMLQLAHRRYGRLPWASLFQPAIQLAESGFPISEKLYGELARDKLFPQDGAARAYFYQPDGASKPAGSILKNPALAATLKAIAAGGADAFYRGAIADDVVATADHAWVNPSDMTTADIAGYHAIERPPVCGLYRQYRLCGMGPPSSGGVAVMEILGLLQPFDLKDQVNTSEAWNLFAQASRLAYADRDRYVGDPAFVHAPIDGMLNGAYLTARAKLIDPTHFAAGTVAPGEPPGLHADNWGRDQTPEFPSTSNMAIVDRDGNALAMTTTIEFAFGSHLMVRGFLLNNELTDFSYVPEADGKPVANRVEGGKRPRSSMAPTLVFDGKGKLVMSVGSAGGAAIITDVAKTLVATLDWNEPMQQAMDLPNISNRNGGTDVEATPSADTLAAALKAEGHDVHRSGRASGLSGIRVTSQGFEGAADDRRAGTALGD